MVVATSTPDAHPSARAVLLRGVDDRGFCFFTNFESRKGRELAANPHAGDRVPLARPCSARCVPPAGRACERRRGGRVLVRATRARAGSSAWASAQSEPIATRDELEAHVAEVEARVGAADPERPIGWGGFRVVPDEIEFWQHRDDRLHDRFVYTRSTTTSWRVTRLQP